MAGVPGSAGAGRGREARLAAEEGNEPVAGAGQRGHGNRVGEQPRAGGAGTSSGAIGSSVAARPGGTGRRTPHAAEMSQPWTAISMAPAAAAMLTVSSRSPMATRRSARPAAAHTPSSARAWRRRHAMGSGSSPGTGPVPTWPDWRASASTPSESLTWSTSVRRSHPSQGVDCGRSRGVASAAVARA